VRQVARSERVVKVFDTILEIWTNTLQNRLDGKVEHTSDKDKDNDGSTEVHNDNDGPTESEHEAEVPNVPVEVDEDRAWDDDEKDEKDKEGKNKVYEPDWASEPLEDERSGVDTSHSDMWGTEFLLVRVTVFRMVKLRGDRCWSRSEDQGLVYLSS
jgi:hypothetical protein